MLVKVEDSGLRWSVVEVNCRGSVGNTGGVVDRRLLITFSSSPSRDQDLQSIQEGEVVLV